MNSVEDSAGLSGVAVSFPWYCISFQLTNISILVTDESSFMVLKSHSTITIISSSTITAILNTLRVGCT